MYRLEKDSFESNFQPQFYVKFTNEISKNGDTVTFRIKVKKLGGGSAAAAAGSLENGGSSSTIEREYDDFEFLHHTLTTQVTFMVFQKQDNKC